MSTTENEAPDVARLPDLGAWLSLVGQERSPHADRDIVTSRPACVVPLSIRRLRDVIWAMYRFCQGSGL